MPRRATAYVVGDNETLDDIARRFKLASGTVLSGSPRNPGLKGLRVTDPAPAGLVIFVPCDPRSLLQERYVHLSRINQFLRWQLDQQSNQMEDALARVRDGSRGISPVEAFGSLRDLAVCQIEALELECGALREINAGLEDAGELVDPAIGAAWLVSPSLLDEWRGFWGAENWNLADADFPQVERRVLQDFNALRSRVLQQADSRMRSTVRDLQRMTDR